MPQQQSQPDIAETPEVRALVKGVNTILTDVRAFKLVSADDYVSAAEWLKRIKGKQKELKALRETITKPMLAALDAARAIFRQPESTLKDAEDALKHSMDEYDAERERERREQQRKLDEAAEKERQRLAQQAQRALTKGQTDKAAELQERAAMTVAPIVQHETPKVAGISRRQKWRGEVFDLRALVQGVADGRVPLMAIEANRSFLNGQATALREELRYPGVRAVPETIIASGSK